MSELARQAAGLVTNPLLVALLLAGAALLLRLRERRRASLALAVLAGLLVYFAALVPVGIALLRPLEARYPPLADSPLPAVRYVVVLGSGYSPRPGVSSVAALDRDGLVRIVEGIRLARGRLDVHLVVSGGAPPGEEPGAHGYARLARDLGVEEGSLIVLDKPRNTAEEAATIGALLGRQPFLLITSAWHMPRAMRLMERAGLRAIPFPTGQLADTSCRSACLLPGSGGLAMTERALHEYLGEAALALGLQ